MLALAAAALLLLALLWPRLTLSYDLGYFLPSPQTQAQQVLVERLGQGPGTQLIFVVLNESSSAEARAAAANLRALPAIERVLANCHNPLPSGRNTLKSAWPTACWLTTTCYSC